jgi:hypothetical protein
MKRNEMVKSIEYVMNDFEAQSVGPYSVADIAEAILEMQEEIGMLPPSTFLEHLGTEDNSWETE